MINTARAQGCFVDTCEINSVCNYLKANFPCDYNEKALEAIDAVLELESKDPSAEILHHAGDIYFMNGMPEDALEFWEKALNLTPEDELLQRKVKHKTFFFE